MRRAQMVRFGLSMAGGVAVGGALALLARHVRAAESAMPPLPPPLPPSEAAGLVPRVTPAIVRYSTIRYALAFAGPLAECAALGVLLAGHVSPGMARLAKRLSRFSFVQAMATWALLSGALALMLLPLSFYGSFVLEHQFGLSRQSLGSWLSDAGKSYAVEVVLGGPLVAGLYALIRRSPHRWWIGVGWAAAPVLAFSILLAPLVVDPLFNRFTPLPDSPLKRQILTLAGRAGIPQSRVFEVDASRRTNETNAYVTGLGGTARIVLWDTTLRQFPPDELLFIVGHEMGHYVLLHIWQGLVASVLGMFGAAWSVAAASGAAVRRLGGRWGVASVGDLASLPVLMLATTVVSFLAQPAACAVSRHFEHQADVFGLAITGNRMAAARAFIRLGEGNLSLPDPPALVNLWLGTHPTLEQRVRFALSGDS